MPTSDRHDLLRRRSFGICRQAKWSMTSEAKSTRVSPSFRSPLISRSMPAPRYCRIRSICWMPDMQTKFVEANGLRFEVLEQGTGVRLALCLHGFPEHAISWRHQIPVLAGMGYRVWAVDQRGYGRTTRPTQVADYALPHLVPRLHRRRHARGTSARPRSGPPSRPGAIDRSAADAAGAAVARSMGRRR